MVAQRLVRRICKDCQEKAQYTDAELAPLGLDHDQAEAITFMKGVGCELCSGTGYRGRVGLFEVMALTPELRRMILRGDSAAELKDQAVAEDMLTLRMDGLEKITQGITTLEEVVKETAA